MKAKAKAKSEVPKRIGLTTSTECVAFRTRPSPDGNFPSQLNLDDLLDVAIGIPPDDAYALLMLIDQDMYEDEDDLFCCGRAYGGSRVAVMSAARYNPCLDAEQGVQRGHLWPACHCESYMNACCEKTQAKPTARYKKQKIAGMTDLEYAESSSSHTSPIHAAVSAFTASTPTDSLRNLWLPRIAQTASHERGHCFALDHCTYYACVMQATGSNAEDLRQPRFLCPVDEAKVGRATGVGGEFLFLFSLGVVGCVLGEVLSWKTDFVLVKQY